MRTLTITPVANGYIVRPDPGSLNCLTPDHEVHVFTTPAELADFIQETTTNHEKTRDASKDLRTAPDA